MQRVQLVYRKYDGKTHWHQWMVFLAEDRHGTWFGAPAGSVSQRADDPLVIHKWAHVMLLPRDKWWTAAFIDGENSVSIYCDVTTPPVLTDRLATMVDLDLDVIRQRDGSVQVEDADEFAQHQTLYGYPPDVVQAARDSCDWLAARLQTAEPFHSDHQKYLRQTRELGRWAFTAPNRHGAST